MEVSRDGGLAAEQLLKALVQRDRIDTAIKGNAFVDQASLTRLCDLDQKLTQALRSSGQDLGLAEKYRLLNSECEAKWWWDFDRMTPRFRYSALLRGVRIGLLWPLNIALAASLVSRLLANESGILGLLAIAASVAVPVLQAQKQFGGAKARQDPRRGSWNPQRVQRVEVSRLIGSMGATIVLSGMWMQLPRKVAFSYYMEGNNSHVQDPGRAIAAYVKALALDPSLTRINASLGELYESQLADSDLAAQHYRKAALSGDIVSLQRLARIELLRKPPNTYAARVFLNKSLEQISERDSRLVENRDKYLEAMKSLAVKGRAGAVLSPDELSKRYRIGYYSLKGWTGLVDGRLDEAMENLTLAVDVQDSLPEDRLFLILRSPATSYCLLAESLDSHGQADDGGKAWAKCRSLLTDPRNQRPGLTRQPEEIRWLHKISPNSQT